MKKFFIILLTCLMSTGFLACGEAKEKTDKSNVQSESQYREISPKEFVKKLKKQGLKDKGKPRQEGGFEEVKLNEMIGKGPKNEINEAIIMGNDKVVRATLRCQTYDDNMNKLRELTNVLFTSILPDFKNYNDWLDEILPQVLKNKDKNFHWDKGGHIIRLEPRASDTFGEYINIDIIEKDSMHRTVDDSLSTFSIINLTEDGKIPSSKVNNSINSNKSTTFFDENFDIFATMDRTKAITYLETNNIKYLTDGSTLKISDPLGSGDMIGVMYNEDGKTPTGSMYFRYINSSQYKQATAMYKQNSLQFCIFKGNDPEIVASKQEVKNFLFSK